MALAALVVTAAVNAQVSADPWLSVVGWVRIIALLLALTGIPSWPAPVRRALLAGFLLAMLGHVVLAFLQFATGHGFASTLLGTAAHDAFVRGDAVVETASGRWLRAYGGFPHPNVFGVALLVGLMLLSVISTGAKRKERMLEMTMWVVLTLALVLTFSRSTLLGLIILLIVLAQRIEMRQLAAVGVVAMVAAIAVTWSLWVPRVTAGGRIEQRSISERTLALADTRALVASQPWLGAGLHAMPAAMVRADPARDPFTAQPVHDVPMLAFTEVGLLGVVVLAFAVMVVIRYRWDSRFQIPDSRFAPWLALVPPLLLDHSLWSLPIGLALIFALAMSATLDTDRAEA